MDERFIARSPVEGVKNLRRDRPIRRTPTMSDFRKIVADLRSQVFNAKAKATADFVEFIGLSGLGNGEAANLRWGHFRFRYDGNGRVDWTGTKIHVMRQKTDRGFVVPIFPHLVPHAGAWTSVPRAGSLPIPARTIHPRLCAAPA